MEPAGARAAPAAGSGGAASGGWPGRAGARRRAPRGEPGASGGASRSSGGGERGEGPRPRGRAAGPGGRVRVREGGFGFPAAEGAWRCRPGPRARAPGGEAGSVSGGHRHVFPAAAAQAEVSGGAGRARPGGGRRPRGSRRARPAQSRAAAEARARSASRAQLVPAAGGGRGAARLCAGPGSPRCGLEPRPGKLGQTASPRAGREVRARGGPGGLGHAGRRRRRARVFGARKGRGAIGVPGWSPQVPGGARGEQGEDRPAGGAGGAGGGVERRWACPLPLAGRTRGRGRAQSWGRLWAPGDPVGSSWNCWRRRRSRASSTAWAKYLPSPSARLASPTAALLSGKLTRDPLSGWDI